MSLAEQYVGVRAGLEARNRDPLSWWRFGVPRLRDALSMFERDRIHELHLRACNKGGKTVTAAAFVIACAQKRRELDGCPLPQWTGPVECAQLTLDYPQQVLSVRPAYLALLGAWPHKATPQTMGAPLERLSIMPLGGDPENDAGWSVIHFLSQKNMQSGKGVRADVVAFDEPPKMDILNELRKASHAGRRGVRLIAETPIKRSEWAPLREDYGESPRRSIRRADEYRAEVRWSLDEVADWVLSAAEKRELRAFYALNPALKDAREHGDYVSTEGACPFHVPTLLAMMAECRDPELVEWRVPIESVDLTSTATVTRVTVEVFAKTKPGATYYGCIDPASGVDDGRHNPAGLLIVEHGSGDLALRWNGYLAPYSLGVLGATLARQYNNAQLDIEMKDHWGVNVVRGARDSDYGHLSYERRELRPNVWSKEVGFDQNEETRAIIIGCVQEWMSSWQAGVKYARCPSRAVLECLMDCELDDRSKIVAGPGIAHGEDLILWGQALRRAVRRSRREGQEIYRPPKSAADRLAARILGHTNGDGDLGPPEVMRAPSRPSV